MNLLRPAYRNYVLAVIVIGFALNFLDRQIITVLLQPIRDTFHVSDSLLGLLSGLSFALFYGTLGIPIAALADRMPRRTIIALAMGIWCAMTTLCAVTRTFPQLLAARIGVGIGEAGFTPAAFSLIADYFPKRQRARAMAVAGLGPVLGIMLGLLIGGWAAGRFGWRGAMLVAGAPGLAFAFLIWGTVREPPRGLADGLRPPSAKPKDFLHAAVALWRLPYFRYIALGAGFSSFALFGFSTWFPSLLARSYHLSPAQIGRILGPLLGGVGAIGMLTSGFLTDRLTSRNARWSMWLPSLAAVVAAPLAASAFAVDSLVVTVALYAAAYFLCIFYSASTSSIVQTLVPLELRSSASGWKLLMENLFGLALGAQLIGFLSDRLAPAAGAESLRHAMLLASPAFLLAPVFYWKAAQHIAVDAVHRPDVA